VFRLRRYAAMSVASSVMKACAEVYAQRIMGARKATQVWTILNPRLA